MGINGYRGWLLALDQRIERGPFPGGQLNMVNRGRSSVISVDNNNRVLLN